MASGLPIYRVVGLTDNVLPNGLIMDLNTSGDFNNLVLTGSTTISNILTGIDKFGVYPNETFAISGSEQTSSFTNPEALMMYFNNSTLSSSPTISQDYTDISTKDAIGWDVAFDLAGNILTAVIEDINGRIGEGTIYKLDPSTSTLNKIYISDHTGISFHNLISYDLRLSVTATNDGGFATATEKQDIDYATEWGTPSTPCTITDMSYWNTNALVSKFDASGIQEWTKSFDVDDQPPVPGVDLRKKECFFSIRQSAFDEGLIIAGNCSYNADDNFIVKLYDDCESRASYDKSDSINKNIIDITTSTTWSSSLTVLGSVVVHSGVTLTITGSSTIIQFADSRRTGIPTNITVEKGGIFHLEAGATLDADLRCDGTMWDGVQVWGDPLKDQYPGSNQGRADVDSKTSINNARCGVLVGKGSLETHINYIASEGDKIVDEILVTTYVDGGGILHSAGAYYNDNRKSVVFDPYTYLPYNHSFILSNLFYNNNFMRDPDIVNSFNQRLGNNTFLTLAEVNAMSISKNEFKNNISLSDLSEVDRGKGIVSFSSDCYIRLNLFYQNYYGIDAYSYFFNSMVADTNDFEYNGRGIRNENVNFQMITRNIFKVGLGQIDNEYGIYLGNCTGYIVEENNMTNVNSTNVTTFGIIDIYETSNSFYNEIYNNKLDGFDYGLNMEQYNRGTGINIDGLKFKCNDFSSGRIYDAAVTYDPGVSKKQGDIFSATSTAGNTFSNTCNTFDGNLAEPFSTGFYTYAYNNPFDATDPSPCYDPTYITTSASFSGYDKNVNCPSNFKLPCAPPCKEELRSSYEQIVTPSIAQVQRLTNPLNGGSSSSTLNEEALFKHYRISDGILNYYMTDTLNSNIDSLSFYLSTDIRYSNEYARLLCLKYLSSGAFQKADSITNILSSDSNYTNLCYIIRSLRKNQTQLYSLAELKLNTTLIDSLLSIAQQTNSYGYVEARNLLTVLSVNSYSEIIHKIILTSPRKLKPIIENAEFVLFPNPISNPVEINFSPSEEKIIQLSVFDLTGKIIWLEKNPIFPVVIGKTLLPGSYNVIIKTDSNEIINNKLIVIQ